MTTHVYDQEAREEIGLEGSIYLRGAHHPVDLRGVAFGKIDAGGALPVTIDADIDFDFEGAGFENRSVRLSCLLKIGEPRGEANFRVIR